MNQDTRNPFDFEENPIPQNMPDISDEIAADVTAILDSDDGFNADVEAIVSAVEDSTGKIGTGLDAIMAEAGDPSLDIGADVAAIMAEANDPATGIGADVAAIMEETHSSQVFEASFPTECIPYPEEPAEERFGAVVEDTQLSAEGTSFFHIPSPEDFPREAPEDEATASAAEPVLPESTILPAAADSVEINGFFQFPVAEASAPDAEAVFAAPADAETAEVFSAAEAKALPDDATQRINSNDPLYHDLLNDPVVGAEIGADEQAISSTRLIHPADTELEQIIAETKAAADAENAPTLAPPPENITGSFPADTSDMLIQDYVDPSLPVAEPVKEESPEKPLPKRRPKMKRNYGFFGLPHVAATLIWLAITVAIGVSLGRMIWVCAAEVLAFGKPDQEYTVTITAGDNIDTVANKLKNAGLIKYPELFKLYAGITDAEEDLSAGTFVLNSKYDYNALVKAMTFHSTARQTVKVLIPEGYTCAQIFALLEEKGVCTAAELEEYSANGEIKDRWFLEGIQRGDKYCLEGYLFPDSYEFYTNDEPGRVLGKFLDNFDARFTTIMKEKIDPLNERLAKTLADRGYTQDYIDAHKITIREIVIIASMIERETANDAESYDISSVIYNRLTNPANYPYLNIDATIIYALGGNIDPVTGKTKPLTKEDLQLDSPYNTYTNPGLIPGPISNPGRNSLNAALDPSVTGYYFYVYNPNISKHIFAKTAAEHNKNVEYVRSLEENS